jgi:hypothetical protein
MCVVGIGGSFPRGKKAGVGNSTSSVRSYGGAILRKTPEGFKVPQNKTVLLISKLNCN